MKTKTFVLLALALTLPSFVKAQGTINFSSTSIAHVIQITPGVPAAPGTATVGLYYAPLGASSNSLVLIGPTVLNGAGGGISGGVRTTGIDVFGGATALFQIRAWTGGYATYEEAYAAAFSNSSIMLGTSTFFLNPTGNPNASPPTTPANLTGWTSPVIIGIPEPSTIALGIFGAGALLFIRLRKSKG
jgi:hypothetical protein